MGTVICKPTLYLLIRIKAKKGGEKKFTSLLYCTKYYFPFLPLAGGVFEPFAAGFALSLEVDFEAFGSCFLAGMLKHNLS